jgi:hypothetical protein
VAARVESVGKGDEILVSQATVAYIDDQYAFIVKRKGWFVPKGKKNKFYVYTCDWQNHPRLINKYIKTSWLPVSKRQKAELAVYLAAIGGVLYFIYLNYLRYWLSHTDEVALRYLNFGNMIENHPVIAGSIGLIILVHIIAFVRIQVIPLALMRLIKAGFVFAAGFVLIYLVAHYAPIDYSTKWNEIIESSQHQYVEVLENNSLIFAEPSLSGESVQRIKAGKVLLQKDFKQIGDLSWNKVLIDSEKYGWIVRVSPPQMGVPEKKVSQEYQFHFRYKDLYIFILGFILFIIGFWKFRILPI